MDWSVVVGVILGFGLSLVGWGIQREVERRELKKRVRTLLHLEAEQNRKTLLEFWSRVTNVMPNFPPIGTMVGLGYSGDMTGFEQRYRLAFMLLPRFERTFWDSQATFLPNALDKDELPRAYAFYANLSAFDTARVRLQEEFNSEEGRSLAEGFGTWLKQMGGIAPGGTPPMEVINERETRLREFNNRTLE